MKKFPLVLLLLIAALFLSGPTPTPLLNPKLQRELDELTKQGLTVRSLDNKTVEVSQEWSGFKRLKTLQEPSEAEIRAWAAARNVPILEIDPSTLDTNRWRGWYRYWTQVPLSNGFGSPLVVDDLDRNTRPEVYGTYKSHTSDFDNRIYEVDSSGVPQLVYVYANPRPGIARGIVDVDRDSLTEILYTSYGLTSDFEQSSNNTLPLRFNFMHNQYQGNVSPGFSPILVGLLDVDSLMDFLYKGSELDPQDTTRGITKTYVAEYDPVLNNFSRVWSRRIAPIAESSLGGYAGGDFDGDRNTEFVAPEARGRLYLLENTANNNYEMIWRDSIPFFNLLYQIAGDVDRDGNTEFYVGATTSTGNWTTMYEADSNNHYSPRFLFHLLSGGVFDEPIYLETDIESDGRTELIIMSGVDLYVFKSPGNDSFMLWYYKREDAKMGVQFYDFNGDGKRDFIVSKAIQNSQGLRNYADAYLATNTLSVNRNELLAPKQISLLRSYPNPFNPVITIQYEIPEDYFVHLAVLNLEGRVVARLVDEKQSRGLHHIEWNAKDFSSGVYFCRLEVGSVSQVQKLLLIR